MAKKPNGTIDPAKTETDKPEKTDEQLAAEYVEALADGKECYKRADRRLAELRKRGLKHGATLDITSQGRAQLFQLIDQFRGTEKVFRTTVIPRWTAKVTDVD